MQIWTPYLTSKTSTWQPRKSGAAQDALPMPKRRENRTARCLAYHCRLAAFKENRRFRVPSGMIHAPFYSC